ncbi:MAG: TQO small subunit DoxD [bacterium]
MNIKSGNLWAGLLRIYIGIFFLYAVHFKLNPSFFSSFHNKMAFFAGHDPIIWYSNFLNNYVIPNSFLFALLVVIGELTAGLLLAVGFLTPIAAVIGIFLNLNYLLAMYWISPANLGINLTFIICELVIIFSDAGKSLGLDGFGFF